MSGDLNPYAYVRGRVMSDVDPWGLDGTPMQAGATAGQGNSQTFTQPNGTTVTWSYDGSFGMPDGAISPQASVDGVQFLVGEGHIALPGVLGGGYWRPNGVAEVGRNAVKGAVLAAADPVGLRDVAKSAGFDIERIIMNTVGDGPKDRSESVGTALLLAGAAALGSTLGGAGPAAAEATNLAPRALTAADMGLAGTDAIVEGTLSRCVRK
jgi:hypothetical protein